MSKVDLTGRISLSDLRRYRRLGWMLGPRLKRKFLYALGISFVAAILELGGLGLLPVFVASFTDPKSSLNVTFLQGVYRALNITNERELAVLFCSILVLYFMIKTLITVFALKVQAKYMKEVMVDIGNRMFEKYLYAPYVFHLNAKSGDIINNVTYVPQYFGVAIILPLMQIFLYSLMVLGAVAMMVVYDPLVALAALLLPALASAAFLLLMRQRGELHGRAFSSSLARMVAEVNHGIGSIKETHLRNCQTELLRDFKVQMEVLGRSFQFQKSGPNASKPIIEFFGVVALAAVICFLAVQGQPLSGALPTLVLFVGAIARILPNLNQVTTNLASLRTYGGLIDRIYEELVAIDKAHLRTDGQSSDNVRVCVPAPLDTANRVVAAPLEWRKVLQLKHVSYLYPGTDTAALNDISIQIPYRSAVAFVGTSGSGKSTLVDVILGLIRPDGGCVLADGTDVHSNLRGWQQNIGYIPQTIYLLDDTVRRNVAFGVPAEEINDNQVWEALRMAQLDRFVRALPGGLDAQVGERGIRFSGGQRQRVGIARALYHQPALLIMDEGTSALDTATEQAIIREISQFKADRTIIMVAHRLSTVAGCDKLFVLEQGRITNQGSFDELLKSSNDFRRLALGA